MKIDTDTLKKQVILHLPYLLFLLVFAKLGQAVRLAPGADASQKLLGLSEGFTYAFQSMWPGAGIDWLIGLCGAAIVRLAVYLKGKDTKKYRKNVEYGSARWGTEKRRCSLSSVIRMRPLIFLSAWLIRAPISPGALNNKSGRGFFGMLF